MIFSEKIKKKTLLLEGRRVKERGVKTGISWITPIQNHLNKPCMELEGNQKPRNTSIAAQTILRIFFAAEGGGLLETRIWGKMPMQHRSYKPYMWVEGYHTTRNTSKPAQTKDGTVIFFFIPRLDCHQKVKASPFQEVTTEQKAKTETRCTSIQLYVRNSY